MVSSFAVVGEVVMSEPLAVALRSREVGSVVVGAAVVGAFDDIDSIGPAFAYSLDRDLSKEGCACAVFVCLVLGCVVVGGVVGCVVIGCAVGVSGNIRVSVMTGCSSGSISSCCFAIRYFACELMSLSCILEGDLEWSNESPCLAGGDFGIGIITGFCSVVGI